MGNCSKIEGMNEYVTATLNPHLPVKNFMLLLKWSRKYWYWFENHCLSVTKTHSLASMRKNNHFPGIPFKAQLKYVDCPQEPTERQYNG